MFNKKNFIIILIILVVVILALGGYYFTIVSNQSEESGKPLTFKSFFPFGGNENSGGLETSTSTENLPENNEPLLPENVIPKKLTQITSERTSGAGVIDSKSGTIVRYVETATGHVYESELLVGSKNRISNTTMPQIYNSFWGDKNNSFVAQYLKDDDQTISTYLMTIKGTSTSTENVVSGSILAENISDVSVLNNTIFYLQKSSFGSVGSISSISGKNRKKVWQSELKELNAQIVNPDLFALTTKPYPNVDGFLYTVSATGVVKKVIGNIPGLSTLMSPDGLKTLYISQSSTISMFVYDKKTSATTNIYPTTFPEKCVWSKKNTLTLYCAVPKETLSGMSLINWYIGLNSYTDDIWKYDLKQNTAEIISDLSSESGQVIDIIKPAISDNEKYIVFTNKIDGSLWYLDLTK